MSIKRMNIKVKLMINLGVVLIITLLSSKDAIKLSLFKRMKLIIILKDATLELNSV